MSDPDQTTMEMVASAVRSLSDLDDNQREWFFILLGGHYKTCCGTPRNGWCSCFAED